MAVKKIDYEKFKSTFIHSETHKIDYDIYDGKTTLLSEYNRLKEKEMVVTYTNQACFGSTLSFMYSEKKFNIKYTLAVDPKASKGSDRIPLLEPIEIKKWFQITRKCKFIPKSVRFFSKQKDNQFIILNLKEQPVSTFYMYLVMFRYVREDPGLVRAFVHLVDEVGVDPYVAMAAVHRFCTNTLGHSAIDHVRTYAESMSGINENNKFRLDIARKLYLYVNNPGKYDTRGVEIRVPYNLHTTINNVNAHVGSFEIPLHKITHKNATLFVYEKDSEKATELYREMMEK